MLLVFPYVHHSTVQCEDNGVAQRLATVPEFCLHFAEHNLFCLPSVYV